MRQSRIALAAAAGVLLSLAVVGRAEPPATATATGSLTGKITGVDGKAASGVMIRLGTPETKPEKPDAKGGKNKVKPKPTGLTATTDKDGAFKIEHVPAGTYVVNARGKDGNHAKADVVVEAGKATDVNLTLAVPKKNAK